MHLPDLLAALPSELRDYIRALEERTTVLQQRVHFLEEQFRLAQCKRFAPSSEKFGAQGCLFNEAEQDIDTLVPEDDDGTPNDQRAAEETRPQAIAGASAAHPH